MRYGSLFFLSIVLVLAFLGNAGLAAKLQNAAEGKTEIVTDEAAGVVRVMIHGKEVARFNERGVEITGGYYYRDRDKEMEERLPR